MVLSDSPNASVVLTLYYYSTLACTLCSLHNMTVCHFPIMLLLAETTLQLFSIDRCDVPESKAATETEIRIRSGIVRKMRRKLTRDASWRGSSGRRRLPIRRLAEHGLLFFHSIMCSVSRFQPTVNLSILFSPQLIWVNSSLLVYVLFMVLYRGWKTGNWGRGRKPETTPRNPREMMSADGRR